MAEQDEGENLYKVLIIGDVNTGKTSLVKQYVHKIFPDNYKSTIGVDFALKVVNMKDADGEDVEVKLQLWDIAGQERFGNMTRVYYKEAVGAFIVFDVTRASTFEAVHKWKHDIDSKVHLPNGDNVPVVLLANKCDLTKEGLVKNSDQMNAYCEEKGFAAWFETSAKENLNINLATETLVNKIIENGQGQLAQDTTPGTVNVKADGGGSQGSCCG